MAQTAAEDLVNDFLGSAHIFANAISHVIERKCWREATGDQLSVTHLKVLKLASLPGSHTIGDVAAFLCVSNAAASKAVDGLVRRSLLRRTEGETDRRAMYLTLSDLGRRIIAVYDTVTRRRLSAVFRSFSPEKLQQAIELLDRLSLQIVNRMPREEFCVRCGIYFRHKCPVKEIPGRQCLYLRQKEPVLERTTGRRGKAAGQTA